MTAAILVEESGDNRIVVVPGALSALTPAHVDAFAPQIAAADVLLVQLEIPVETALHALEVGRARRRAHDPQPGAGAVRADRAGRRLPDAERERGVRGRGRRGDARASRSASRARGSATSTSLRSPRTRWTPPAPATPSAPRSRSRSPRAPPTSRRCAGAAPRARTWSSTRASSPACRRAAELEAAGSYDPSDRRHRHRRRRRLLAADRACATRARASRRSPSAAATSGSSRRSRTRCTRSRWPGAGERSPSTPAARSRSIAEWVGAEYVHGQDGMGDSFFPQATQRPEPEHAVDELVRRVDESPGELTILAQAPLTNLADGGARATRRSPQKVGHLYVMGGGEGNITPAAEYNFFVDPEAAKIVLNAGFPLTLFTWTLTKSHGVFDDAKLARIAALGTPLAEFFGQVNRKAREFDDKVNHLGGSTHPDSMVCAAIVEPSLVLATEEAVVDVETAGELTRGWNLIDTLGRVEREPNASVVTDYDTEGFFELMLGVLAMSYLPPTRELRVRLDTAQALTRLFYREQAVVLACGGWIRHASRRSSTRPSSPGRRGSRRSPRTRSASASSSCATRRGSSTSRRRSSSLGTPDDLRALARRAPRRLRRLPRGAWTSSPTGPRSGSSRRRSGTRSARSRRFPGSSFRATTRRATRRTSPRSFYWPDVLDPAYPYGEGVALQLRSAVSHLNEVWAVETAGRILDELSPELGWEFTHEAARWLYDETRHMLMGKERLARWGFEPAADPARRLHLRGLAARGSALRPRDARLLRDEEHRPQARARSGVPRDGRRDERDRHGVRLGRRDAPRRVRAPLAAARSSRPAARTPSRGRRCSSAASSSSRSASPARPPRISSGSAPAPTRWSHAAAVPGTTANAVPGTVKARGLVLDALGERPRLQELTVEPPGPGRGARPHARGRALPHRRVAGAGRAVHADPARPRGGGGGRVGRRAASTGSEPGDPVLVCWKVPCGRCRRCARDEPHLCEDVVGLADPRDVPRRRADPARC